MNIRFYVMVCSFGSQVPTIAWSSRSANCFSLGWPMRDDCDFFQSIREARPVSQVSHILLY